MTTATPATPATPASSDVPGGVRLDGVPEPIVIRQLYLGCLSQASYLVGDASTGRAVVVDPRRDVDEIVSAADADGLTVEMVIETHFHADFLSGHLEVAAATGAEIGFGAAGTTEFPSRALHDGEVIDLGGVELEIWETPGHTPESISIVVRPSSGAPAAAVLTGDTLFIGDVGRPDLLVAADIPAETLGSQLYDSVHRLAALPEETLVLPAHGAGSACGKSLSTDTVSTIGEQRQTNYALAPMDRDRFVALVTEGQVSAPGYFGYDARKNREARPVLDEAAPVPTLDLEAVDSALADGAVVVDARPVHDFSIGHLAGSLGVSLDGRFAEQVGSVVGPDTPIVLVADPDQVAEARLRLARIGFDNVLGAVTDIDAVLADNPDRAAQLSRLTATELADYEVQSGDDLQLVDVRNAGEVESGSVPGAVNIPLAQLRTRVDELDADRPVVLVCAGGARSAIASSVLSAAGFEKVADVLGGATALGVGAGCSVTPQP